MFENGEGDDSESKESDYYSNEIDDKRFPEITNQSPVKKTGEGPVNSKLKYFIISSFPFLK